MRKTLMTVLAAGMAMTTLGRIICSGNSAPVAIDSRIEPAVSDITVLWDASWIGGDANATVVISDNGTEVKRTTGAGEFTLFGIGRHELTYTTYVNGVAQDEVYAATVYAKWKYEVVDGSAVITETTQTSGAVTIPTEIDGYPVTGIAGGAFKNCTGLTSVAIPASVTSIGSSAFSGCAALRDVVVPQCVCTNRMSSVFPSAYEVITNVVISDTVTSIGASAFSGCSGLTSVTIPKSVTSIVSSAFSGCSGLTSVHISDLVAWCGITFGNSSANPLNYANNLYLNDSLVTNLAIPDGVTNIEAYAFSGCSALISVTIPSRVTSIGTSAFSGCSGLTSVHITDLAAWCEIAFGNDSANPLNCAHNLYLNDSLVTNLSIPDGVTSIRSYAFSGCSCLTSVVIPDCLTSIGNSVFSGCSGLKDVTVNQYVCSSRMSSIFPSAYQSITNVVFSDGVTSIGSSVFSGCSGLTSVTIPDSVTSIGSSPFSGCSGLTSVTIPYGLTSISSSMFSGCCRLTNVTIPDGVTSIGAYAFDGCSGLTSMSIPDGVTGIGSSAFRNCNGLKTVIIPRYVCSRSLASVFPSAYQSITNVVVSDGVTSIANAAFSDCSALVDVTIPTSVKRIGDHAFDNCPNLQCELWDGYKVLCGWLIGYTDDAAAVLSDADNLHGIISWALEGCVALKELSFSENALLVSIGTGALKGCTELRTLVLPPSLEEIGDEAFMGCSYLDGVIVPGSVRRVGARAFKNCTGFTAAQIEHGVESLGVEVFYGDWRITEVDIPSTVTNIGVNAFGGDSSIIRVGLRGDVRPVAEIFSNYQYIREATVKAGDRPIVDGLFTNCTQLLDVRVHGDCPSLVNNGVNIYRGTRSDLTTYVEQASSGWDGTPGSHALPQAWPLSGSYRRSIAWWDVPTYRVQFDSNGGTLGVQEVEQRSEHLFVLPSEPTKDGQVFAGWWTRADGGMRVTAETVFVAGVYTTLYAHWVDDPNWKPSEVAAPTVTPGDGATFAEDSCTVIITCATEGAVIYYSTDGSTPRPSNRFRYTGPFTITDTTEICTVAVVDDVSSDFTTVTITKTVSGVLTLAGALDVVAQAVTTGGDADWMPVEDATAVGGSSARSGAIAPEESTWMEMTVLGAGTLSFSWKADCEKDPRNRYSYDFGAFAVDGNVTNRIDGTTPWQAVTVEIAGGRAHVLRWTYSKDDYDEDDYVGNDCIWVDHVVWTPSGDASLAAWLAERNLTAESRAANGRTAAECYVLGLDPADATNDFRIVSIEMVDGEPKVEWEPKTNRWTGVEIQAVLKGAETLERPWKAVEGATAAEKAAMRFFKVVVEVQ